MAGEVPLGPIVDKGADWGNSLVSAFIYLEGGGNSKELHTRCREGFRKLLENCGFKQQRRMPRLTACGGRDAVFDDFKTAHANKELGDYIAMWIDSEEPLGDLEATWKHLGSRDGWMQPAGTLDEQVLFMTTCMETWIVTDRAALLAHYGNKLQISALPSLIDLETRGRHDVQNQLAHATRDCSNAYHKGKRSFEILAKLTPSTLDSYLPSFVRIRRILDENL